MSIALHVAILICSLPIRTHATYCSCRIFGYHQILRRNCFYHSTLTYNQLSTKPLANRKTHAAPSVLEFPCYEEKEEMIGWIGWRVNAEEARGSKRFKGVHV